MSLFNFGKKNSEEKNKAVCKCGCSCENNSNNIGDCSTSKSSGNCETPSIKVLGAGCQSCHKQYEYAKEAVKKLGLSSEVEYITDMAKIMRYGVMSMPALVVNEKVISMGKILKTADIIKLLQKLGFNK